MSDRSGPRVTYDVSGQIGQDLPCIKCGYNLRGLSPQQICPECGQHVFDSTRGDWLEYSDPQWVGRVARGMQCICWTPICAPLLGAVVAVLSEDLAIAAMVVVFIIGFWEITAPEPRDTDREPALSFRRIARFGSIAGLLLACVLGMVGLNSVQITSSVTYNPGSVPCYAAWLLILSHAGRLARRIPQAKLAKDARFVVRSATITVTAATALAIASIVMRYLLPALSANIDLIMTPLIIIALGSTVLLLFWSIKLVFDLRKQFNAAAEAARYLDHNRTASSPPNSQQ